MRDSRDPNCYAGIAWSIGGVCYRPWFSRGIFGEVLYMSLGGARGKFDVDEYVGRWGGQDGDLQDDKVRAVESDNTSCRFRTAGVAGGRGEPAEAR